MWGPEQLALTRALWLYPTLFGRDRAVRIPHLLDFAAS